MRDAGPFAPEACRFVRDGLSHTVRLVHGEGEEILEEVEEDSQHVSGQQLCIGLRDYAVHRYGMLAKAVLNRWGLRTTEDFGRVVFAMVDAGLMRKSDEDSLEDFRGVFDFEEEFRVAPVEAPKVNGPDAEAAAAG
ncbi:MAG: Minf_1886 family protein [Planctomycetota bacterium]